MNIDLGMVTTIQFQHVKDVVLVSFRALSDATRFIEKNNLRHVIEHENVKYTIPVYLDDKATNVRIHDLSKDTTLQYIKTHMAQYGEVISGKKESWKNFFRGIDNGVWLVRMRLKKPIPSYVELAQGTIHSQKSLCTYEGQIATCKYCHQTVHYGKSCAEAATENKTAPESNQHSESMPSTPSVEPQTCTQPEKPTQQPTKSQQTTDTSSIAKPTSSDYKTTTTKEGIKLASNGTHCYLVSNNDSDDKMEEDGCELSDPQTSAKDSPPRKKISTRNGKLHARDLKDHH
ncbi:uncharacterized protein LOC131684602 [Topomyia yanbarensis]|uniref:uncharacterized protein LOC131684602 n=1 Tax=Topomyia yanbarensis TaxID=2498891 RepID=UPI00273C20F4|nr:uncharacterized protein LOC131684602 [Topomyia yanbarensis]